MVGPDKPSTPAKEEDHRDEKMDKVWSRAKTQALEALDWSKRISQVGKLKLDTTRMQRNRTALFQELGQKTFELLKEGRFDPTTLGQLVAQIDNLTVSINELLKSMDGAAKKTA
jgi:hypothetical protein